MNVVQEIHRINAAELASGSSASWHDQYKDSAYVYVGGLAPQLTEGDVITIFSQYGEVVDISLPRDSATQKPKGFAFLMYADQRSTVLAVDNLGGAKVLERTLKVDHVLNYKQLQRDEETGKMVERDVESLAAHPDKFKSTNPTPVDDASSEEEDNYSDIDIDDPMRDYLIIQRKVAAAAGGGGKKGKGKKRVRDGEGDSTKEERKAERERKRRAKEEKAKSKERKAIEGSSGKGREKERSGRREDERRDDGGRRDESRKDEGSRSRDDSSRRREGDGDRRRDDRDDRDSKRSDRGPERRRDDDDGRRRDDRRDDRRDGRGEGSSFADLEKWAKG